MGNWLAQIPKIWLIIGSFTIGIGYIVLSDPPKGVCDAQMDVFKKIQKEFLYLDPKKEFIKTTGFMREYERCQSTNAPGGCYELFDKTKKFLADVEAIPKECVDKVRGESAIKETIVKAFDLMVRIAWGSKPPELYNEKFKWLDSSDMALFCRLKKNYDFILGNEALAKKRESYFEELPGAKALPRQKAWESMILSENCSRY